MHGKVMSETGATFRLSSVYTVKNLEKDLPAVIIEEIFPETKFKMELDLLNKQFSYLRE